MENGWIKLYRKSKENPLMLDANAWMVFSWLMLTVNRSSGEMSIGRFWASEYFRLKPTTFYKILKRLEKKYNVVTLTSNNRFTTVRLLNWAKYQDKQEPVTQAGNNKVTTKGQQSNNKVTHIQEYKNIRSKELKNNTNVLTTYGKPEINELLKYIKTKLELPLLDDTIQHNRNYANLCIKKFGLDKTKLAIDATSQSSFWRTQITSFRSLYNNAIKIVKSMQNERRAIDATNL